MLGVTEVSYHFWYDIHTSFFTVYSLTFCHLSRSCVASPPLKVHIRSTSLVCYIASIGEMLVRYARPPTFSLGAMDYGTCSHKLFAQQLALCSIFKHLVIQSCLRGLPAAAVGSPVLFVAPSPRPGLQNESRIEFIVQSMFQSRVQLLRCLNPHLYRTNRVGSGDRH